MNNHNQLKIGADPRGLADHTALRDELAKLSHPARPDVDWQRVEQLSLSLFRQNGVELQTASWYALARTRLAGMAGLNEGLLIFSTLLTHHWGAMWPQQVHARIDILTGFSQRLQSMLRGLTLYYTDLPHVYQTEQYLNAMRDGLQRLELKNISQIGDLCHFMRSAATRLENRDVGDDLGVVSALSASSLPIRPHKPGFAWRSFLAGMLMMLIIAAVGAGGWHTMRPIPDSLVPVVANETSLSALEQMSPLWRQNYGFALARVGMTDSEKLTAQWQRYITGNALPVEDLSGWHQGMEGLQALTRRLNTLDERKGKYLTGSELKSMVFAITQNFSRSKPVEEQLYLLSQADVDTPNLPGQLAQTDIQINQLLNRYALIKQQVEKP